jgi:hypothetical protein
MPARKCACSRACAHSRVSVLFSVYLCSVWVSSTCVRPLPELVIRSGRPPSDGHATVTRLRRPTPPGQPDSDGGHPKNGQRCRISPPSRQDRGVPRRAGPGPTAARPGPPRASVSAHALLGPGSPARSPAGPRRAKACWSGRWRIGGQRCPLCSVSDPSLPYAALKVPPLRHIPLPKS